MTEPKRLPIKLAPDEPFLSDRFVKGRKYQRDADQLEYNALWEAKEQAELATKSSENNRSLLLLELGATESDVCGLTRNLNLLLEALGVEYVPDALVKTKAITAKVEELTKTSEGRE